MKTSEADILFVPGWSSSGPDHWQSRWQRSLKTARRVEQDDWLRPTREAWVARLVEDVAACVRPVVLVGHSLGVVTIAHAAERLARLPGRRVAGAFLVAPADVEEADAWPVTAGETFVAVDTGLAPLPTTRFAFPSVLVASSDDPYCRIERARELAEAWGAVMLEPGAMGHINVASGHGPWPEGLLSFGMFLKRLSDTERAMHH